MPARLTRADLTQIPAYKPGRNPDDLAREVGFPHAIKLASNELPFGPLPGVIAAITEAAANVHRYPDMSVLPLREALGGYYDIDPARIVVGGGSVALCELVALATATFGDEIVFGWRSFEAYPIIAARTGARAVLVPNKSSHELDVDAIIGAITDQTRLIFLCTPNNPTGTALSHRELTHLLDAVPANVLIAIDEAYHEFVTDPQVPDALSLAAGRDNVVVLRTFSKAWGLAGARVGYLIGAPAVAETVRKILTPFSNSTLAQAAALAALNQQSEMERRVSLIVTARARVLKTLHSWLPEVPSSQGNFCWLPLGEQAVPFAHACEARGVIVRPFANEGVRVTIGTPAENDEFLAVAEQLLS